MKKFYVALLLTLGFVLANETLAYAEPTDYAKSLMEKAEKGDAEAQLLLGAKYFLGQEGLPQDYTKGLEWYEKSALQGDVVAQYGLGFMYMVGQYVRQDYIKARHWFEKSAQQKNPAAQIMLGIMYEKGWGVRQNFSEAKEWYGKACDNGSQDGCRAYARLNTRR